VPCQFSKVTNTPADWASDRSVAADTLVTLNGPVPYGTTYSVLRTVPACRGGADDANSIVIVVQAPGGGEMIGWVAYVHHANVGVTVGQVVYADTVLGTIAVRAPHQRELLDRLTPPP